MLGPENSLLLLPYLTYLMRMTFKFLNPIPMRQVFLNMSNQVVFIYLFQFLKLLGNLTT